MGDFEFGSQEHIDGLSRKALEADFRFVVDRMREAEGEWERLKAENEKLKKRLAQYELFSEVVGDPAHEFASLRRELHHAERENAKLRELAAQALQIIKHVNVVMATDYARYSAVMGMARQLGIEVE